MEDVERALARDDPSVSHAGASPSERRVVTAPHGARGLAGADVEQRLVSRAACDALAELQRRLDVAKKETRDAVEACRAARAERETAARDRERERREWLANRDAVRKEIAAARDCVAAVKDEHGRNLAELDRERRRTRAAVEETSAVRDELARAADVNVSLERRLARARAELAAARAELAARDDVVDEAMAANARHAAIAAREALRRTRERTERAADVGGPRISAIAVDEDDDAAAVSAPPSPSPTTVSYAARDRGGSVQDPFETRRARSSGEPRAGTSGDETLEPDADVVVSASRESRDRVAAAEALAATLARLNAVLLDRLGDAIGATPSAAPSAAPSATPVTETAVRPSEAVVRDDAEPESAVVATRLVALRALESEVKAMDAEYRDAMAAIAKARDGGLGGARGVAAARARDVAAARANALEDAIVRKVEEVQRLRDASFESE